MATFIVNQSRTTSEPFIDVETLPAGGVSLPTLASVLLVGRHRFQLIVEDNSGNRSEPAFVDVTVTAPTGGGRGGVFNRDLFGDLGGLVRPG